MNKRVMQKSNIVTDAITLLEEELDGSKELYVEITSIGFVDTFSDAKVTGEFASIRTEEYNEGFYYNLSDGEYYYYGEALFENPGSLGNKYGFVIKDDDLKLLPEKLKDVLLKVARSKVSQKIDSSYLMTTFTLP